MADHKDVHLDDLSHGKHGDKHEHGHHDRNSLLDSFQRPEALFTSHRAAPVCFFLVNVVLLALTAQVFQKTVFVLPDEGTSAAPIADSRCNATSDGGQCGTFAGFVCFGGQCMKPTDECYGKQCLAPADSQCSIEGSGFCDDGSCHFAHVTDNTRCRARGDSNSNSTDPEIQAKLGWTCQEGRCESPTRRSLANFAYMASIQAGIIGSALALEILLTRDFTPDLAALAINAGLIVIGFDGRLYDIGLETNTGLGRTQVAFGFIAGAIAVLFGAYLLSTKKGTPSTRNAIFAYLLIAFWLVAFGIISNGMSEMYEHFDNGETDTGANVAYNWAYWATIFAASVNIALAHAVLRTGTYTQGFAAFALITGVIALAWASKHEEQGEWSGGDFSDSITAWHSLAIIAGAFSIILGILMIVFHKATKTDDQAPPNKMIGRLAALVIVVVFWTLIGLVASLFDKSFLDRSDSLGNDMRVFQSDVGDSYANIVSGFAWDFSIWASAVASAFGIELLFHGSATGGITALTLTQAANLVGWAAKHADVGSQTNEDELESDTRAWEAIALVAGIIAFLVTLKALISAKAHSATAPAPQQNPDAQKGQSLNADDRDLFATGGGKQGDH